MLAGLCYCSHMTNTEANNLHRRVAVEVARQILARAEQRADLIEGDWRDWSDPESFRRYLRVLRSVSAVATGPRKVQVTVELAPSGSFGHVASEAADFDVSDIALAHGVDPTDFHGVIDELAPGLVELSW